MTELVIDAHFHTLSQEAEEFAAGVRPKYPSSAGLDFQGWESARTSREKFSGIDKPLLDAKTKIRDMDRMGVDLSVLSASPTVLVSVNLAIRPRVLSPCAAKPV